MTRCLSSCGYELRTSAGRHGCQREYSINGSSPEAGRCGYRKFSARRRSPPSPSGCRTAAAPQHTRTETGDSRSALETASIKHSATEGPVVGDDTERDGARGDGESDVGLHADPRRAQECRPLRGPLDHSPDPEGGWPSARTATADLVADGSQGALGRDRRGGLFHDRGVELAWVGDLLHGVRHWSRLAPVHILGSTPYPGDVFMGQIVRLATSAEDGVLIGHRVMICDRDRKWGGAVRHRLGDVGIRVVLTPERAPNANAHAERFVRSIKEECLGRIIPLGERHFRRANRGVCRALSSRTESPRTR